MTPSKLYLTMKLRGIIYPSSVFLDLVLTKLIFNTLNTNSYLRLKGLLRLGYFVKLSNPVSFNERILSKKIRKREYLESLSDYVDKFKVRKIIADIGYSKYLIDQYFVLYSPKEFNYENLPDSFVMKANHGSGMNFIVADKYLFPPKVFEHLVKKWLEVNYNASVGGTDFQYDRIKPAIIIEKLLIPRRGGNINDYKIFCFNGKAEFISLFNNENEIPVSYAYDRNWNQCDFSLYNKVIKGHFEIPENFDEMIDLAENLSKPFDFVRIDLYNIDGKIYFGEFTFTPGGGFARFFPRKYDFIFGEKFNHFNNK